MADEKIRPAGAAQAASQQTQMKCPACGGSTRFDPVKGIEKNSTCDLTLRMYDANGEEVRTDSQVPDEIIASVADQVNIRAYLPVSAAVILVALSIFLTLLGGLIPSKKAARQDPVAALRSE